MGGAHGNGAVNVPTLKGSDNTSQRDTNGRLFNPFRVDSLCRFPFRRLPPAAIQIQPLRGRVATVLWGPRPFIYSQLRRMGPAPIIAFSDAKEWTEERSKQLKKTQAQLKQ